MSWIPKCSTEGLAGITKSLGGTELTQAEICAETVGSSGGKDRIEKRKTM